MFIWTISDLIGAIGAVVIFVILAIVWVGNLLDDRRRKKDAPQPPRAEI